MQAVTLAEGDPIFDSKSLEFFNRISIFFLSVFVCFGCLIRSSCSRSSSRREVDCVY